MAEPLDLETVRPWMQPCGPHDYGMPEYGCACPDGDPRPIVVKLVAEVERLRAAIGRVEALGTNPAGGPPPDGTIVLARYRGGHQSIDLERVYVRSDRTVAPGAETPDGDWWLIGDNEHPRTWAQVLWLDDPACDRGAVDLEWLVPVEDIARALSAQVAS